MFASAASVVMSSATPAAALLAELQLIFIDPLTPEDVTATQVSASAAAAATVPVPVHPVLE